MIDLLFSILLSCGAGAVTYFLLEWLETPPCKRSVLKGKCKTQDGFCIYCQIHARYHEQKEIAK